MPRILSWIFPGRYERPTTVSQCVRSQYGPFLADKYPNSEPFYQQIIAQALPYVRGNVLDVGCAAGRLVFEWQKGGAGRSVGVDSSRALIELCKQVRAGQAGIGYTAPQDGVELVHGNILTTSLAPASFDFISCINVLDRVANPAALVSKLHELLRPGGTMMLVTPYDWELSPAPASLQVSDAKSLLGQPWEVKKEQRDISYTVPIGILGERTYECHLLIAAKL